MIFILLNNLYYIYDDQEIMLRSLVTKKKYNVRRLSANKKCLTMSKISTSIFTVSDQIYDAKSRVVDDTYLKEEKEKHLIKVFYDKVHLVDNGTIDITNLMKYIGIDSKDLFKKLFIGIVNQEQYDNHFNDRLSQTYLNAMFSRSVYIKKIEGVFFNVHFQLPSEITKVNHARQLINVMDFDMRYGHGFIMQLLLRMTYEFERTKFKGRFSIKYAETFSKIMDIATEIVRQDNTFDGTNTEIVNAFVRNCTHGHNDDCVKFEKVMNVFNINKTELLFEIYPVPLREHFNEVIFDGSIHENYKCDFYMKIMTLILKKMKEKRTKDEI